MSSLQVVVQALSGVAAGKTYHVKLVAGGKEQKTGKAKKDLTIGETFTFEGTPDSLQVSILGKDKTFGNVTISVTSQSDGETVTDWHTAGEGKVQLAITCHGYPKTHKRKKKDGAAATSGSKATTGGSIPISKEKLDHDFAKMVEAMGAPPHVQAQLMALPDEAKYDLLSSKNLSERERDTTSSSVDQKPQYWITKLQAEANPETFRSLQIRLSHEHVPWLTEFHTAGGFALLVKLLDEQNTQKKKTEEQGLISKGIIACLTSFMDNTASLNLAVNKTPNLLTTIAATFGDKSLDYETRTQAIKLLSIVTMVEDGHDKVMAALNALQEKTGDKSRFSHIVTSVSKSRDIKLRVVLMTFINAICNSPDEMDRRVALRNEFAVLGFNDVLDELRKVEDSVELDTQVATYDEEKAFDDEAVAKRFAHVPDIKVEDSTNVFEGLKSVSKQQKLDDYLLNVLQNLLSIRFDSSERGREQWILASKVVRFIANTKLRNTASETQLDKLLDHLLKAVEGEATEHFQLVDLRETNAKTQRDLETKQIEVQEKSEVIRSLELELEASKGTMTERFKLEQDLENTKAALTEAQREVERLKAGGAVSSGPSSGSPELASENASLKADIGRLQDEINRLKSTAPIAPPTTAGDVPPPPGGGPPPPPPPSGGGGPPPPPPPPGGGGPPPPPPPGGGGPPPPPPPGGGPPPPPGGGPPPPPGGGPPPPPGMGGPPPPFGGVKKAAARKRPEIVPTAKVRNFQWTKLPEAKVAGTLFADMPLEISGFKIDFSHVETQFAQVEAKKSDAPGEVKKKDGPISVFDPKTSQNLSIFINGFKNVKYSQVAKGILNLDDSILTPQQIATFTTVWPSPEDLSQLTEYVSGGGDASKLAPAEQFALEVNTVPALLQRMKTFRFKSEYETKKSEIKPDIAKVANACKQVKGSEKLLKILEIVLHLGNFLNAGGNKGQAWGFKMRDLQKLVEAKTTDNKSTLLNVMVELIQKEQPALLDVSKEVDGLELAQRVNLQQLQGELSKLTKELEAVTKSVESVASAGDDDQYHQKVREFTSQMAEEVTKMNTDFAEMQSLYDSVVTFYVEDPKATGPDEFFALFTTFLKSIDDTVKKMEAARIAAEKAEKRGAAKAAGAGAKKALPGMVPGGKKGAPAGQGAVVNELFGQLAAGNPFKNRRKAEEQPAADAEKPAEPSSSDTTETQP